MNICFVGGGNMASALIGGMLKRGFSPVHMCVVEINADSCKRLHKEFGVRTEPDMVAEGIHGDVVVFAVKPQQMREVALRMKPLLGDRLVISVAAGIRAEDLSRWLGTQNIVRAMPNTPALIRSGITGLYALPGVSDERKKDAQTILAAVGKTLWLKNETMMDAVTAVSGSGPAYVFYFMEAMQEAARELGFNARDARRLVQDTFAGATKLAESSDENVSELRARVTSKNGTTERAVLHMELNGVKQHIISAMQAAAERSKEMGEELGKEK